VLCDVGFVLVVLLDFVCRRVLELVVIVFGGLFEV